MGTAGSLCVNREAAGKDSGEEGKDRWKNRVKTGSWRLVSVQIEDGLVLHLVEAGEGLNYLAEWGAFHGGVWYLPPAFSNTVEPWVGGLWRQVNLSLKSHILRFSKPSFMRGTLESYYLFIIIRK